MRRIYRWFAANRCCAGLAGRIGFSLVVALLILVISAQAQQTKPPKQRWAERADPARISQKDPLTQFTKEGDVPSGWFAYTAYVVTNDRKPEETAACFAVLRAIGEAAKHPPAVEGVRFYPPMAQFLYYCHFSPDGRYLALGAGWPYDRGGNHYLWIWDRKAQKILPGPQMLLHWADVVWSPDSSKFTFVAGGSGDGHEMSETDPIRLYTYDLRTQRSYFLAQDSNVLWNCWSPEGHVLYSATPSKSQIPSAEDPRANIYEIAAHGGTTHAVIENGMEPQPSPDGKWIVYHGWPEKRTPTSGQTGTVAAKPQAKVDLAYPSRYSGLYLWNRLTQEKTRLRDGLNGVTAQWLPDSKALVLVEQSATRGKDQAQGRATLKWVDIPTVKSRPIASLSVTGIWASMALSYPDYERQFEPLSVSPDGKWICIKSVTVTADSEEYGATMLWSLWGVQLQTGKTVLLAQTQNLLGSSFHVDWHFAAPGKP